MRSGCMVNRPSPRVSDDLSYRDALALARKREGAAIEQAMRRLTRQAEHGEPMEWRPEWDGLAEQRANLVIALELAQRTRMRRVADRWIANLDRWLVSWPVWVLRSAVGFSGFAIVALCIWMLMAR